MYSVVFRVFSEMLTGNYLSKEFVSEVEQSCLTLTEYNVKDEILENFGEDSLMTPSHWNLPLSDFSVDTSNSNLISSGSTSRKVSGDAFSSQFRKNSRKDSHSDKLFASATFDDPRRSATHSTPEQSPTTPQTGGLGSNVKRPASKSKPHIHSFIEDSDSSFESIVRREKHHLRRD